MTPTYDTNSHRPNKELVLNCITRPTSKSHTGAALFLPSTTMVDLKKAVANGTVHKSQRTIIVEHNPAWAALINKNLTEMGFTDLYVHVGKLEELNLSIALNGKKITYAHIDTCSQLNIRIAKWIRDELQKYLVEDTEIHFTFALYRESKRNIFPSLAKLVLPRWSQNWRWLYEGDEIDPPENVCSNAWYVEKILRMCFCDFITVAKTRIYRDTRAWMYCVSVSLKRKTKLQLRSNLDNIFKKYEIMVRARKGTCPSTKRERQIKPTVVSARPPDVTPQQWAWSWNNPNSIRNKKASA